MYHAGRHPNSARQAFHSPIRTRHPISHRIYFFSLTKINCSRTSLPPSLPSVTSHPFLQSKTVAGKKKRGRKRKENRKPQLKLVNAVATAVQQRKEKEQRPAGAAATKAAGAKPEPCKQSSVDAAPAAAGTGGGSTQMQSNRASTLGEGPGHNNRPVNRSPSQEVSRKTSTGAPQKTNPPAEKQKNDDSSCAIKPEQVSPEQLDGPSPCNCGKRKKHESTCGSKPAATAGNAAAKGKVVVGEESSTTKPRRLVYAADPPQAQPIQAVAMCPSYRGDPCRHHSMEGVREKKGRRNMKGVEQLRWCCYSCKAKGRKRPTA